uniref:Uncharacterized protein n=1 Tax=Panagrolaimus davidi TaxID=227884 RepID=A0A914QFJ0_9BILA
MFGRAFLLSTFIVAVIFISTLNATSKCTLNGKEVPCHTLQELSSRQKRSVSPDWNPEPAEVWCSCDLNGNCEGNCTIYMTTPAATASPAALEKTTTTASDSIKNGYGICLIVASIFAYLFLY